LHNLIGGRPKLIEAFCDHLPCGNALLVPRDNQSTNPFRDEAGGIVPVPAFNLKGAGPKLSIVNRHGQRITRICYSGESGLELLPEASFCV